jgi:hypothetical protein
MPYVINVESMINTQCLQLVDEVDPTSDMRSSITLIDVAVRLSRV